MPNSITYTYAGDSITDPDNSWSWTRFISDDTITTPGGVAISGATSAAILAKVVPVEADVLVVLLGTNDTRLGKSRTETKSNIEQIVTKVGASRVVLVAIPPCNITDYGDAHINRATNGFALNRELSELAVAHDWLFVDPWFKVRRLDNTYAPGTSVADGVHPSVDTGTETGNKLSTYIRQAVEGATA